MILFDFLIIFFEVLLVVYVLVVLMVGVYLGKDNLVKMLFWVMVIVFLVIVVMVGLGGCVDYVVFYGMFIDDVFLCFVKVVMLIVVVVVLVMSVDYL